MEMLLLPVRKFNGIKRQEFAVKPKEGERNHHSFSIIIT
jgi:hypothetical protein